MAVFAHEVHPGFRGAVAGGGEQVFALGDAAMRAGADAGIILVAPIDEVVVGFGSGACVIGDFVRGQPEFGGFLGCGVIQPGGQLFLGQGEFAAAIQCGEFRALFDGELVERQMVRRQGQRLPQFRPPRGFRLLRAGVDEVERDAWEDARTQLDGFNGLASAVLAAEEFQSRLVKTLYTDGDAVDPGGAAAVLRLIWPDQ